MKTRLIYSLVAMLIPAAVMSAVIAPTVLADSPPTPAPTSPGSSCPSRTVCAWSGSNYSGTYDTFSVVDWHSDWINFDNPIGFHPYTITDNSGSVIWVYDEEANAAYCLSTGPYWNLNNNFGWFFIEYNQGSCAGAPVPLPFP